MKTNIFTEYEDWSELMMQLGHEDSISKENFLSESFADLITDDDDLDTRIGSTIREVVIAIADRHTFDYIKQSDKDYVKFILVANILYRKSLIDYGTSIRGCWFVNGVKAENLIKFCKDGYTGECIKDPK